MRNDTADPDIQYYVRIRGCQLYRACWEKRGLHALRHNFVTPLMFLRHQLKYKFSKSNLHVVAIKGILNNTVT